MAEARISVDQNEFLCLVCQDLLKDPVAIPCGHSYCKICINGCWDQEDQKRVYSCPQCRQTFSPRPALAKNTMLAEVVEKLKKRKLPADCYAGAGDVQCDVCTGRKHKAVKSCMVCLESYCQNHLEQHESLFRRKRHNLTEATGRLQEMICQKHDKILEVFCRTDQKCICVLCMDEHKNHDIVSAAAQRTEKQHQLKETQRSFQQRIQQREKDLQQLREAVKSHKRSAQTAVKDRHEDQKGSQCFGSQAKRNGSTQIISSKIHDFTVKEAILRQTWVQKQVMYNNKQIYFDNDYFPDLQRRAQVRDMIRQLKKKDSTAQSFYPAQLKISLNTGDKTFSTLADALPTLQELGVKTQMGKCDALEMELSKAL
ncbi:E3 ubiquitin/ISG15 ligase TRIM25-like [Megalobrama amblycephala]|uniref:E3 ubiquitin/ISG15 ligase TRIM25-like n=1 Tax=Megalobrama amblycephala TaxID=75352 RepID=UPI0020146170|nr:E3 ubiquitin/ISG15 ligase TRIM25-like [Megalobrama amblycephala]